MNNEQRQAVVEIVIAIFFGIISLLLWRSTQSDQITQNKLDDLLDKPSGYTLDDVFSNP